MTKTTPFKYRTLDIMNCIPFYGPISAIIVYVIMRWIYYVRETERDLKKNQMISAIVSSMLLTPVLLTLMLFAHLPNLSYSLKFVPIFVLMALASCLLCVLNVYRVVSRREDDDRTNLHLLVLSCLNLFLLSLIIIAVLFVILKLDKVLDWEWSVVFVPLWVINSIFLCADVVLVIQVVNAMREAQVSHNRIEYAGRLAAFVFLLNILVIPGIASEILVTVNGLRAIVRVSPLILSYVIIFLVVVIDRVISVTVYIEQLLSKWDTRSKLREKMKMERSLHSVMNRENAPIKFSIVDVRDEEERNNDDDEKKEEESSTRVVESKIDASRSGNFANFERTLNTFRAASTEQEVFSLIETLSSYVSKSAPACRARMRRSILGVVRSEKMTCSKMWTQQVRNDFGDLIRESTPLFSFMRILMDEISIADH